MFGRRSPQSAIVSYFHVMIWSSPWITSCLTDVPTFIAVHHPFSNWYLNGLMINTVFPSPNSETWIFDFSLAVISVISKQSLICVYIEILIWAHAKLTWFWIPRKPTGIAYLVVNALAPQSSCTATAFERPHWKWFMNCKKRGPNNLISGQQKRFVEERCVLMYSLLSHKRSHTHVPSCHCTHVIDL